MKRRLSEIKDILTVLAACALFGAAFNVFIRPARIVPGGLTGLATVINRLFPILPVGSTALLLNLPLFAICCKVFGRRFILRSAIGTVLSSVSIDLFSLLPFRVQDPLLGALFGGGAVGASIGLLYARGYNTGGADLLVFLIKRRHERFTPGKLVFIIDAFVLLLNAAVFRDLTLTGYSMLTVFSQTKIIDSVLAGSDRGQLVFIFTNKCEQIAQRISLTLGRGVTEIDATGYYSGKRGKALLCAIRKREVYLLKQIIRELDPNAFSVFTDAFSISGNGFEHRPVN